MGTVGVARRAYKRRQERRCADGRTLTPEPSSENLSNAALESGLGPWRSRSHGAGTRELLGPVRTPTDEAGRPRLHLDGERSTFSFDSEKGGLYIDKDRLSLRTPFGKFNIDW